jgi:Ner family transcriptional regulator
MHALVQYLERIHAMKTTKMTIPEDWHKANIIAAIRVSGTNLSKLSEDKGYSPNTLRTALNRAYPTAEKIIAKQIGVPAPIIWPSRYSATEYAKALNDYEAIKPAKAVAC